MKRTKWWDIWSSHSNFGNWNCVRAAYLHSNNILLYLWRARWICLNVCECYCFNHVAVLEWMQVKCWSDTRWMSSNGVISIEKTQQCWNNERRTMQKSENQIHKAKHENSIFRLLLCAIPLMMKTHTMNKCLDNVHQFWWNWNQSKIEWQPTWNRCVWVLISSRLVAMLTYAFFRWSQFTRRKQFLLETCLVYHLMSESLHWWLED